MAPPFTKPHVEPSSKRVRVLFGGQFVVDTIQAKLVWEKPYYPYYYFPDGTIDSKYLESAGGNTFDLVVGNKRAKDAVTKFSASDDADVRGLVKVEFSAPDAWFEEDERVFVHPKDPYKRVDVLQSSRHIRVEVNGVEVANTRKPRLLFETSLRTRTYIPMTDCRLDLFAPSSLQTECPYKGVASYYDVHLPNGDVAKDVIWWYRTPQPECGEIKGYLAFYDEKVDVWVDGVKQPR